MRILDHCTGLGGVGGGAGISVTLKVAGAVVVANSSDLDGGMTAVGQPGCSVNCDNKNYLQFAMKLIFNFPSNDVDSRGHFEVVVDLRTPCLQLCL